MEATGTLHDVITHEMGHVLGVGAANSTFLGDGAMEEFCVLLSSGGLQPMPVENTGGPGTRDGHWRESVFRNELMTGFIGQAGNPLSRTTVAGFGDLGYQVDLEAADPYELPNLMALAVAGQLVAHTAPIDAGIMLTSIPIVLPQSSL